MNKITGKHSQIVDSEVTKCGDMKCFQCHKPIEHGHYLLIEYDSGSRGNEDDFARVWHKECSLNHPLWVGHDISLKKMKEKQLVREEARQKIIAEIEKWGFDASDLFDFDCDCN